MTTPKIIILMCTYNGERYLTEQLDSIRAQTHDNWELWVSDDGSQDHTLKILNQYQQQLGEDKIRVFSGPRKGFSANFLSLACQNTLNGAFFAFCDQDDIWHPTKLQDAIAHLNPVPDETPALYCSRTKLVDEQGNPIGYSPLFSKKPSFLNALIQSIGGGNTMMLNKSALLLLQEAGEYVNIAAHDWWTYMLVTGAGGQVFYNPKPTLDYRQHGANQIGGNIGWAARLTRISLLFKGRFKTWNDLNFNALLSIKHRLTEENKRVLIDFMSIRDMGPISRILSIKRLGLYRQTLLGTIGIYTAALFNKI